MSRQGIAGNGSEAQRRRDDATSCGKEETGNEAPRHRRDLLGAARAKKGTAIKSNGRGQRGNISLRQRSELQRQEIEPH